jgi:hypothetical protein
MRKLARLSRVDGNNNVHVDVPPWSVHESGADPIDYEILLRPTPEGWLRTKLSAAAARYLGDREGLGQDARHWPVDLSERAAGKIVAALPFAAERIREERAAGRRASRVIHSNELARVSGDDPIAVAISYGASTESGMEYERRIREIKSADEPVQLKAEKLAEAVLRFNDEVAAARAQRKRQRRASRPPLDEHVWTLSRDAQASQPVSTPPLDEEKRIYSPEASRLPRRSPALRRSELDPQTALRASLSSQAQHFLESAEALAAFLATQPHHDWSGPVISYCKAFELETVNRVVKPLCRELDHDNIPDSDLKDKDIGRVAAYCARDSATAPELGVVGHFLQTAVHTKRRAETSPTLRTFRDLVARWSGSWLLDENGAIKAISELTKRFRNPAAHTGELRDDDYRVCREFVAGPSGILWDLLSATGRGPVAAGR